MPDASPAPRAFTPPAVLEGPRIAYPRTADGRRVDVELLLTIDEQGHVVGTEVLGHIPADAPEVFDQVARDAAATIRFAPAQRNGAPIAVRVRYHMMIAPPVAPGAASEPGGDTEIGAGAEAGAGHTHAEHSRADHAHPATVTTPPRAATPPVTPPASPTPPVAPRRAPPPPPRGAPAEGITVRGERAPESRGASDFFTVVGGLRNVPVSNASDLLRLAPGILLTNEGGEGHAERVYLRGFDAREGQDLEFTVNGVPINEVGNPHGEGYADTHFIIPELVRAIRVLEGPFDPHQGNFAVAGSAEYQLGLDARGVAVQYQGGSFNTHRVLALWGPEGARRGTFAGADLRTTDGFGQNRAAQHGRAMAQYEHAFGPTTTLQVLATSYATRFGTAGVVREDDYNAGRVGFFDSYDATQGGDSMRHGASVTLEDARPERTLRQQVFGTFRTLRLRANFTGFLEDPPAPYRSGNEQRGDATDQSMSAFTVGARGSARLRTQWRGQSQAIEVGYYGRFDAVESAQRRNRFGTNVPYRVDFDYAHAVTNLGLYVDAEARPWRWLTVRGGVRGDFFHYNTLDRCALHDAVIRPPVVDTLCYERDRTGMRDPTSRRSASGLAVQPRATVMLGPFADFTFTGSVGTGARAADPAYLGDGNQAPFASIFATEGGAVWSRRWPGAASVTVRAVYYYTHSARDLIFNQQEGRNTLAPGTRRQGVLAAARLTASWFDWAVSATYAHARFDREAQDPGSTYFPPDAGDRVPFVPDWVVRSDASLFGPLPRAQIAGRPVSGRAALGVSYVSPRALLFGERGESIFLIDASAGMRWDFLEVGLIVQNLLDSRYRLSEFNYVSEFRPNTPTPNLIATRHFTAGPPFGIYGTLTVYFGARNGHGNGNGSGHAAAAGGGES